MLGACRGLRIRVEGSRVSDLGFRVLGFRGFGFRNLGFGGFGGFLGWFLLGLPHGQGSFKGFLYFAL